MNVILTLTSVLIFCFSLIPSQVHAAANTYYVTQSGAGGHDGKSLANAWSVSNFNNPANWSASDNLDKIDPGDTIYFSGTITTRIVVQGSGTSGNYITLDGYEAGDCDPINSGECGALITSDCDPGTTCSDSESDQAIRVIAKDYIIIQDFTVKNRGAGILVAGDGNSSATADYDIIRRNYVEYIRNQGLWIGESAPSYSSTTNCTMGGGPGQGNLVHDAGWAADYSRDLWDVEARGNDIVISYNKFYNDIPSPYPPGYPGNIIESGETNNILIEHNEIAGAGFEAGIALKERGVNGAIIRYNKIHDNAHSGQGFGIGLSSGTTYGNRTQHVYIYGNEIYNNYYGIGIYYGSYDVQIWSNIIRDNKSIGLTMFNGGLGGWDGQSYANVINNVFANNGTDNLSDFRSTGIDISTCISPGCLVENNIFYNNRPNDGTNRHQVYVGGGSTSSITTLEHNTYYRTSGTPTIWWGGTQYTIDGIKGIGQEDDLPAGVVVDPGFMNPSNNNYVVSGTKSEDYGKNLSGSIGSLTIQGKTYVLNYNDGLYPTYTNWNITPPKVVAATRDSNEAWIRGAYLPLNGTYGGQLFAPSGLRILLK
jgi:hypothetical protein